MDVTHTRLYGCDGYKIEIYFSPSDFNACSNAFFESKRYKLFQEMTKEELRYTGQNSTVARDCALEWLSGGNWSNYREEALEYRRVKSQEKKAEEENKLTVEKCLTFLQEQGYNFCISSTN